MIRTRRVYEAPRPDDGYRVLVDRLWPRGVTKEAARLDEWLKEIAPTPELRKWFDHEESRWEEFVRRYREELARPEAVAHLERLAALSSSRAVTLLYATRADKHNSASVVRDEIEARLKPRPRSGSRAARR